MELSYQISAIKMVIYFNKEGDHDHNGLMFALSENVTVLRYLEARSMDIPPYDLADLYKETLSRANQLKIELPPPSPPDHERKQAIRQARVHPLMRPLVLRCNVGDTVKVTLKNEIEGRWVGLHLISDGYNVKTDDGSQVGENPHSLIKPKPPRTAPEEEYSKTYTWECNHEGVFPFHDGGNYSGGEDGTNVHGLFGALIVEPKGMIWRDPVTGQTSEKGNQLDGLYIDIIPTDKELVEFKESTTTLPDHDFGSPEEYVDFSTRPHREFVIFFHDEPEYIPPHGKKPVNPCAEGSAHGGGHGGHGDFLPIMPVSYRAEPMVNREHTIWKLLEENPTHFGDRPVLNEEQHHSSWMFGDPATPILKAYIGDPVRIRFVHSAVKETHVFHLHMYEWHVTPTSFDKGIPRNNSPRIDAISVSPQTAHTIEPVWGAGNRHQVAGDVIWHCHLYPHFHEGMWGIFRTFETLQEGSKGERVAFAADDEKERAIYKDRYIGQYPDGAPIERLLPLPDPKRNPPPRPTPQHPGYPLYIPGRMQQKSPIPPWPDRDLQPKEEFCNFDTLRAEAMPRDFNYRAVPFTPERNAFNKIPVPGELFTRNPFSQQQKIQWKDPRFKLNGDQRERCHTVVMDKQQIQYNGYGWHDKDGHLYYLEEEGNPDGQSDPKEPLFFRALHGQILNLAFQNLSPLAIEETEFDHAFPPCERLPWQGECALHVHMVKFDPICGDGASTGWNYISGPVAKMRMMYRWWLDQEFGTIFFHDHLFANYRQKHGLFGALVVEPIGSKFWHPKRNKEIISGLQARIQTPKSIEDKGPVVGIPGDKTWARELCIGIADFIPMWDKEGNPLNPPPTPGGHGDQGVMALNYRCEPIHERLRYPDPDGSDKNLWADPSQWFSSLDPYNRDPYTTLFETYSEDPLWFRILQGSHEEQHSFQIHGMRWRRFRVNTGSAIRNQQTFGISEAFTFANHEGYPPGDYMYKLSGADDLWLGCWGLVRAFPRDLKEAGGLLHLSETGARVDHGVQTSSPDPGKEPGQENEPDTPSQTPTDKKVRHFEVTVRRKRIVYREPDLVDPYGLVYTVDSITAPDGISWLGREAPILEPLVLRCREGEYVKVTLRNEIPDKVLLEPEPHAPEVPVEETNPFSHRPERPVSSLVSMHADLVKYDVQTSDGANVGRNPGREGKGQAVKPRAEDDLGGEHNLYYYEWDTSRPEDPNNPEGVNGGEPLGPVLLQDMADFRNHRHHGLIGALIIERQDATPYFVPPGETTAPSHGSKDEAWHGSRATVLRPNADKVEEAVLLMQDGLRLYLRGNIHSPISDEPPAHGEDDVDHEDQGQKGFNYRSEPVGPTVGPEYDPNGSNPPGGWLENPNPATPVFNVPVKSKVHLYLLGAQDKPRNQSFTVHGVTWPEWRFMPENNRMEVASESAITCGSGRLYEFTPEHSGDYAYRSGILKWAVPQGLWGIIRVR